MKIIDVDTTEEIVLNPALPGLRLTRLEWWTDDPKQHYPYEYGYIRVANNPPMFDAIRDFLLEVSKPTLRRYFKYWFVYWYRKLIVEHFGEG